MFYSLWLTFSEEDSAVVSAYIKSLGNKNNAPVFFPHCTLYSPIQGPPGIIEKKLSNNMDGIKRFCLNAIRVNQSHLIWKTVFIELEMSPPLLSLNRLAEKLFLNPVNPYVFNPHISLIYKKMNHGKREEIIANLTPKKQYHCTGLQLVRTDLPIREWKTIFKMELEM